MQTPKSTFLAVFLNFLEYPKIVTLDKRKRADPFSESALPSDLTAEEFGDDQIRFFAGHFQLLTDLFDLLQILGEDLVSGEAHLFAHVVDAVADAFSRSGRSQPFYSPGLGRYFPRLDYAPDFFRSQAGSAVEAFSKTS